MISDTTVSSAVAVVYKTEALEFNSGIFGLPLRLLAREVYDKCVLKLGTEKVALITGEEKIIPSDAKYYICTVESMPKD